MILRVVVLKSVLSSVPPDVPAQHLFCGIVIGILNDLAENCVVLVDDGNLTTGELFEAARRWPTKFRTNVLTLLRLLRTRNRFIKIKAAYAPADRCAETTCKHCLGIANAMTPSAVITAGPCLCPEATLTGAPAVSVQDYSTSPFYESRAMARVHQLNRGEWDAQTFERRVLIPLFIDAKLVKIYDRWIGNSIQTRNYDQKVLLATKLEERFRNTLEWMVSVFLAVSTQPTKRLEVFSGIDTRNKDNNELAIMIAALKTFENDIRTKYKFPLFTLTIKEETRQTRMLHGRYLLTDQLGIVMERGFDLLMDDQAMKDIGLDPTKHIRKVQDCLLAHCPDAGKVEQLVRTLRDLT